MIRISAASLLATLLAALLAAGGDPAAAANPARVESHGSRALKAIALTFDDGVSPANCRRILADLVEAKVPATFFPMANVMRLDPDFWRLAAKAGYPIGDHTVTHPHMARLGYKAQLRQLTGSRALVESVLGRRMLDVFRPPYGEYNGATRAASAAAGFRTILLWDVDPRDWSSSETLTQKLAAAERGTSGSILVLHCGPNATPYLVPDLIDFYRHHAFSFVTVPQMMGVSWSAGPTAPVAKEEILGDLSPLPASPDGGPIVDINGNYPAGPSSSPPPPPGAPSSPRASPPPSPSSIGPANPPPISRFGPTASSSSGSANVPGAVAPSVAVLVAVGLALVVVRLLTTAILRRSRR